MAAHGLPCHLAGISTNPWPSDSAVAGACAGAGAGPAVNIGTAGASDAGFGTGAVAGAGAGSGALLFSASSNCPGSCRAPTSSVAGAPPLACAALAIRSASSAFAFHAGVVAPLPRPAPCGGGALNHRSTQRTFPGAGRPAADAASPSSSRTGGTATGCRSGSLARHQDGTGVAASRADAGLDTRCRLMARWSASY